LAVSGIRFAGKVLDVIFRLYVPMTLTWIRATEDHDSSCS